MAAVFPFLKEKAGLRQSLGARVDHLVTDRLILGPMGHQTQRISRTGPRTIGNLLQSLIDRSSQLRRQFGQAKNLFD